MIDKFIHYMMINTNAFRELYAKTKLIYYFKYIYIYKDNLNLGEFMILVLI